MVSIYCGKHFRRIYGLNVASKKLFEELIADKAAQSETGIGRERERVRVRVQAIERTREKEKGTELEV